MGRIIPILIIIAIVAVIFSLNYQKNLSKQSSTPPQTQNQSTTTKDLLINSGDIGRIKQDYNNKLRESNLAPKKEQEYEFHYKLSPKFSNKQSSLINTLTKVLGVTSCDISAAPDQISVYELKNKINEADASDIAKEFDITEKPTSLPEKDGTFQYFFSNKKTDGNLTLYASSGTYVYHKVLKPESGSVNKSTAENIATEEIKKHKLDDSIKLTNSSDNGDYVFHYTKEWDNLPMVDLDSIIALGIANTSICNVQVSPTMNFVEVFVKKDGQLARFINQTRVSTKKVTVPRVKIEDALKAFGSTSADLPVKPIVIPEDTSLKSGDVEIDDATLVWFDFGNVFPQKLYVPFYLTSGKSPKSSSKVYTLFPAVSVDDLVKAGISVATGKSKQTLQIDVYVPPPAGGIGYSCPAGVTVCCPGGVVDYGVSCTQGGRPICSRYFSLDAQEDINKVCTEGTFSQSGTITPTSGSDPCVDFAKKYLKDTAKLESAYDNFTVADTPEITDEPATCQVTGSPC